MQVDILMPDGTWVNGRSDPQDVANHIGSGGDLYYQGTKYTLINRGGSMFNPDAIYVRLSAGVDIPLRDFLSSASAVPGPEPVAAAEAVSASEIQQAQEITVSLPSAIPPVSITEANQTAPQQSSAVPLLVIGIAIALWARRNR